MPILHGLTWVAVLRSVPGTSVYQPLSRDVPGTRSHTDANFDSTLLGAHVADQYISIETWLSREAWLDRGRRSGESIRYIGRQPRYLCCVIEPDLTPCMYIVGGRDRLPTRQLGSENCQRSTQYVLRET